jgi:chemotaxis protein MotB
VKSDQVIIIKKKKHGKHGHHGGAWKVAYADFVTAMMAFFLVMWIVGQSPQVKAAVAAYFKDPGAFELTRGNGLMNGATAGVGASSDPAAGADIQQARMALERAAQQLRAAIESLPEFEALRDRIRIELTPEGLRIELLEDANDGFFEVGSSALKTDGVMLLGLIASKLGELPNHVAIEGHTDSRPYISTDRFSNWELSTDRANAARRVMQRTGLGDHQIEGVRGYADTRPRFTENSLDARNRRISIIVRQEILQEIARPAPLQAPVRPTAQPSPSLH